MICNDCKYCIVWGARDIRCVRKEEWQKPPYNGERINLNDKSCCFFEEGKAVDVNIFEKKEEY